MDNKKFVAVLRRTGEKKEVSLDVAVETVKQLLEEQDAALREKALEFHKSRVKTCLTMEEAVETLTTVGGFARVPFFTDGPEGKEGDKIIHAQTGGEVRGFVVGEEPPKDLKCIATGKPATVWAYVAKSY